MGLTTRPLTDGAVSAPVAVLMTGSGRSRRPQPGRAAEPFSSRLLRPRSGRRGLLGMSRAVLAEPRDRLRNPVVEGCLRLPAEQVAAPSGCRRRSGSPRRARTGAVSIAGSMSSCSAISSAAWKSVLPSPNARLIVSLRTRPSPSASTPRAIPSTQSSTYVKSSTLSRPEDRHALAAGASGA